jgi:hypothetical protein
MRYGIKLYQQLYQYANILSDRRLGVSISLQCLHYTQVVRVIHISLTTLSHRDQSLVQRLPIRSQIRRSRHR